MCASQQQPSRGRPDVRGCGMHRLIELFDNPALAAVFVLAIYVCIRVIVTWIVGLLGRYPERAADPSRSSDD